MDQSDNSKIISIESDSKAGSYYSVNTSLLTCSCPHFFKKLHARQLEDPQRLCKHLVKALTITGIPDYLKQYSEDIHWFADRNAAFTNRENALKSKKWDKNLPLPDTSMTTTKWSDPLGLDTGLKKVSRGLA